MKYSKELWQAFQKNKCQGEDLHVKKREDGFVVYVREFGSIGGTNYHSLRKIDDITYNELIELGAIKS